MRAPSTFSRVSGDFLIETKVVLADDRIGAVAAIKQSSRSGVFLVLCPGTRDDRELARLNQGNLTVLRHEYASIELEYMAGAGDATSLIRDPLEEVEVILASLNGQAVTGVISTDDYPGSVLACIVAERLGLPAPKPAVNLLCQHKFQARVAQRAFVPDAVPAFAQIDVTQPRALPAGLSLPAFVKPVKSFFSIGAGQVTSREDLSSAQARWSGMSEFFRPFERILEAYTPYTIGSNLLVVEESLRGRQVTLEGYAWGNDVYILGVVDSIMYPGTISFERFEYPSSLPEPVQQRMGEFARRLMRGIGYQDGMFNIEFMYDPETEAIRIIEINPRMASQFADLYEKVDGTSSYEILLDLASGVEPRWSRGRGSYSVAASCVLRTFEDMVVRSLPREEAIRKVEALFPGCRIDIHGHEGRALSEEMQDGHSYRYACINLGGSTRADVLAKLEKCKRSLGIELEPL